EPSVRMTHITAVNKYKGKPNFTAAGLPVDGRSGGGLFTAEGYLIGICNAADPADNEGLYAGLASIHWQLDQIGQSEIYHRAARAVVATTPREPFGGPQLPAQMPAATPVAREGEAPAEPRLAENGTGSAGASPSRLAPVAAAGDDSEIVFIVRSKR